LVVRSPPVGRLEGVVNGRTYEAQWRAWRRLVPVRFNSIGDVVAVPSVALQRRGWPHRADSDGKTVPAGPTSRCGPV
jgi:hypothetical protein